MADIQENAIILKSRDTVAMSVASLLCVLTFVVLGVIMVRSLDVPWWIAGLMSIASLVFCIWNLIASCRTVVLTPKGCEIHFAFLHKMYYWEELKTKCYVDYTNTVVWSDILFMRLHLTDKTFECSPNVLKKHSKLPLRYASFHPFSYVIIYLHHEKPPKFSNDTYLADTTLFKNKLAEWGVAVNTL